MHVDTCSSELQLMLCSCICNTNSQDHVQSNARYQKRHATKLVEREVKKGAKLSSEQQVVKSGGSATAADQPVKTLKQCEPKRDMEETRIEDVPRA